MIPGGNDDSILGGARHVPERSLRELESELRYDAPDAVPEILGGFRDRAGLETAPMAPVG